MKRLLKGLSSIVLSVACIFGVTGCGEKAKEIDFEENYAAAQTAALSINSAAQSSNGFYMDMSMDMVMNTNVEGLNVKVTVEMDVFINHIGDNYYMETSYKMLGKEEISGAALEKASDGTYTGYSWGTADNGDIHYIKSTLSGSDVASVMDVFTDLDDMSYGIKDVFEVSFENIESAMKESIDDLIEEDSFSELPITIGDMNSLVITKSATEKGEKKTFKVTAELPSQLEEEKLSIMYGIVVDGEKFDSLLMEMKGSGNVDGLYMSYDANVVQHIERKGRTDKASLPKDAVWQQW